MTSFYKMQALATLFAVQTPVVYDYPFNFNINFIHLVSGKDTLSQMKLSHLINT